jgi:hypothetical protein
MHVFDWADKFVQMYIMMYCTTIHIHKGREKTTESERKTVKIAWWHTNLEAQY